jgi:hypothetical protein
MRRILALAALALFAYTAPALAQNRPTSVKVFNLIKGNAGDSISAAAGSAVYTSRAIPVAGAKLVEFQLQASANVGASTLTDSTVEILVAGIDTTNGFQSVTPSIGGANNDSTSTIVSGISGGSVLSNIPFRIVAYNSNYPVTGLPIGISWVKIRVRTRYRPLVPFSYAAIWSLKTVKLRCKVYRDNDESPHYELVPDIVGR